MSVLSSVPGSWKRWNLGPRSRTVAHADHRIQVLKLLIGHWTFDCGEVKQLHQKLLPKLSAFRGFWEVPMAFENLFHGPLIGLEQDARLEVAMRESQTLGDLQNHRTIAFQSKDCHHRTIAWSLLRGFEELDTEFIEKSRAHWTFAIPFWKRKEDIKSATGLVALILS